MRILLTGANGHLGRAVRRVGAREHEFVFLERSVDFAWEDGSLGFRGSVTDRDLVFRAAKGCQAIIHTAAMHGSSAGKEPNSAFIETNVMGAENLFSAALEHGIRRLVMSSTMEVQVGRDWGGYGTAVLDESLPPRPTWIYPVTKLQVEVLGGYYARIHGLEVAHLRFVAFDNRPWLKLGLNLLARNVSDTDAAVATLLAATVPNVKDAVFNIGPDTPLTQADVNQALSDPSAVLERHWPGSVAILAAHQLVPKPTHFWPVTRVDKAKLALNWKPRDSFEAFLIHLGWKRPPLP